MSSTTLANIRLLKSDIAASLPEKSRQQADIPALLIAGIGLRGGCSMLHLSSVLPGMSIVRFRLGLSRLLSDAELSIWYFEQLEAFNDRVIKVMEESRSLTLGKLPVAAPSSGQTHSKPEPHKLPVMPVACAF